MKQNPQLDFQADVLQIKGKIGRNSDDPFDNQDWFKINIEKPDQLIIDFKKARMPSELSLPPTRNAPEISDCLKKDINCGIVDINGDG